MPSGDSLIPSDSLKRHIYRFEATCVLGVSLLYGVSLDRARDALQQLQKQDKKITSFTLNRHGIWYNPARGTITNASSYALRRGLTSLFHCINSSGIVYTKEEAKQLPALQTGRAYKVLLFSAQHEGQRFVGPLLFDDGVTPDSQIKRLKKFGTTYKDRPGVRLLAQRGAFRATLLCPTTGRAETIKDGYEKLSKEDKAPFPVDVCAVPTPFNAGDGEYEQQRSQAA